MASLPSRRDSCTSSTDSLASTNNNSECHSKQCVVLLNNGIPNNVVDLRAKCSLGPRYTESAQFTDISENDGPNNDSDTDSGLSYISDGSAPSQELVAITCKGSSNPFLLPAAKLIKHSNVFATLSSSHRESRSFGDTSTLPSPIDLTIDHEIFIVFARFLSGGPIALPPGATDANGYGTDIYTLMHAHAAGETLQAPIFTDMVMDAIITSLTTSASGPLLDLGIAALDARAKLRDLDLLLPAACLIFPPGSIGRAFFIDWYAHSPSHQFQNLATSSAAETGDLDFLARCMVKLRNLRDWGGEEVVPPWVEDGCRYHVHRGMGRVCYKRGRRARWSGLEFAVRRVLGEGHGDGEELEDEGFGGSEVGVEIYKDCVDGDGLMDLDEGGFDCEKDGGESSSATPG